MRIYWINLRLQEDESTHPFQKKILEAKEKLNSKDDYLPYEAATDILETIFGQVK